MVEIKVFREGSKRIGLSVEGHSGYAEFGKDIICSAISVLSLNLINSVEEFTDDNIAYDIFEGYLSLDIYNPSKEAELLFNSCVLGLESIYEEYGGNYLKISNQEVK